MKKKITRLHISSIVKNGVAFCCLIVAGAQAQENSPASPREPLLPKAPEMAAWTITYQYPSGKKQGSKKSSKNLRNRISSIQIEKTGDTYHKITRWDTGKQSEAWSVKGREVIKGDIDSQYVPTPADGPDADDFTNSDFEDLSWLSMNYYVKPKKDDDQTKFVFRAKRKDRPLTRREKLTLEAFNRLHSKNVKNKAQASKEAALEDEDIEPEDVSPETEDIIMLNSATQLPVQYEQGPVKWTYEFTQPPTNRLAPPAEVNALVDRWNNFIKSSESAGSPP